MRIVENGAPIRADRHAALIAEVTLFWLRQTHPDTWFLTAELIGERLQAAGQNHRMRFMLRPSPEGRSWSALKPHTNAKPAEAEREKCQAESRA